MAPVFLTGGTGYMGRRLIKKLVAEGRDVTALVRKGSEHKLPPGVRAIIADPFDPKTFQDWIRPGSVYVQLLGLAHPLPRRKKELFREVDLRSVQASAQAAKAAGVSHFVYVSVAMAETKIMKSFQDARREGEACLLSTNIPCTIVRPWYVLGPGRWWPVLLLPFYGIAKFKREWERKMAAFRMVWLHDMVQTLANAVQTPAQKTRILEISHIRKQGLLRTLA